MQREAPAAIASMATAQSRCIEEGRQTSTCGWTHCLVASVPRPQPMWVARVTILVSRHAFGLSLPPTLRPLRTTVCLCTLAATGTTSTRTVTTHPKQPAATPTAVTARPTAPPPTRRQQQGRRQLHHTTMHTPVGAAQAQVQAQVACPTCLLHRTCIPCHACPRCLDSRMMASLASTTCSMARCLATTRSHRLCHTVRWLQIAIPLS